MSEPAATGWGVFEKSWAGNPIGWYYEPGRVIEAGGGGDGGMHYTYDDASPAGTGVTSLLPGGPEVDDEGTPVYSLQPATTVETPAGPGAKVPGWVVPVLLFVAAIALLGGDSK